MAIKNLIRGLVLAFVVVGLFQAISSHGSRKRVIQILASSNEVEVMQSVYKNSETTPQTVVGQSDAEEHHRQDSDLMLARDKMESSISTPTSSILSSRPLCTREQIRQGTWMPKQYDKLPYLPRQLDIKTCYAEADLHKPWNSYEWQPRDASSCELTQWDSNLFCTLTQNQTVFIMGDSLSLEHYSALVHILGVTDFYDEEAYVKGDAKQKFVFYVCPHNTTRLVFFRQDYLFPKTVKKQLDKESYATDIEPDIVVFNRGAWYAADDALAKRVIQLGPLLHQWQERCRTRQNITKHSMYAATGGMASCIFIWRTTVPGVPNCTDFSKPATNLEEMEQWTQNVSHYIGNSFRWHWYDFAHQNQFLLNEIFPKEWPAALDYHVMDAYEINLLRPDDKISRAGKKVDCFHNCAPSSTTLLYNQLLLHIMRQNYQQQQQQMSAITL